MKQAVSKWVHNTAADRAKRRGGGAIKLRDEHVASKHLALAFDHAIRGGTGMDGLRMFVADSPVGRLGPHEQRVWRPRTDTAADVQADATDRMRRAFVLEEDTGRERLEIHWSSRRPSLWCYLDMGSAGWSYKHWLYLARRVRGWWYPDPAHRRHDNFTNSLTDAHLNFVKHEITIIVNAARAPFKGCAHFGKFSEAADELFGCQDHTGDFWSLFYKPFVYMYFEGF